MKRSYRIKYLLAIVVEDECWLEELDMYGKTYPTTDISLKHGDRVLADDYELINGTFIKKSTTHEINS